MEIKEENPENSINKSGLQDGFSRCEYCNFVGKSESFFSKSKRFCSCVCSRSYSSSKRDKSHHSHSAKNLEKKNMLLAKNLKKNLALLNKNESFFQNDLTNQNFEWGSYLEKEKASAAPVSTFRHCQLHEFWQGSLVSMKVEVVNKDVSYSPTPVYWIASVKEVAGYLVKLRYEGFEEDSSRDFWIHLLSVHPVGWCASNGKHLVPPKTIQSKRSNWKDYLLTLLTGSWTLPPDFISQISDDSHWPLLPNMQLELVNKMMLCEIKPANVIQNKGGRLKLRYQDSEIADDFFWCHCLSDLIHPIGWSMVVGVTIDASQEYKDSSLSKAAFNKYHNNDATPDMFFKMASYCKTIHRNNLLPTTSSSKFSPGMKLEAVDPLNLSCICVATVVKVLHRNHIMISIDNLEATPETTLPGNQPQDMFCFHSSSSYIFPVGFCSINNLTLTPPRGYKSTFDWYNYLQETKSTAAPVQLFNQEVPKHEFRVGMKLEAVDLMDPKLICVATITQLVGRLMKLHFDGWDSLYDQWVDLQSPDVYPVGWCQLFNHKLELPKQFDQLLRTNKKSGRNHVFKGGRKRKKLKSYTNDKFYDLKEEEEEEEDEETEFYGGRKKLAKERDFFSESSPIYSPCESDGEVRSGISMETPIFSQRSHFLPTSITKSPRDEEEEEFTNLNSKTFSSPT